MSNAGGGCVWGGVVGGGRVANQFRARACGKHSYPSNQRKAYWRSLHMDEMTSKVQFLFWKFFKYQWVFISATTTMQYVAAWDSAVHFIFGMIWLVETGEVGGWWSSAGHKSRPASRFELALIKQLIEPLIKPRRIAWRNAFLRSKTLREQPQRAIQEFCEHWDHFYIFWQLRTAFSTFIVILHKRLTWDSICKSCNVCWLVWEFI